MNTTPLIIWCSRTDTRWPATVYLKTKGMDPSNHPVLSELERVKGYFTKIKAVQDTDKEEGKSPSHPLHRTLLHPC